MGCENSKTIALEVHSMPANPQNEAELAAPIGVPASAEAPPSPAASACPFCAVAPERIVRARPRALLLWDAHPLHPGHALAVPRRHIASWFDATEAERADLIALIDEARALVLAQHGADGFNLGINDGPAAGQTVPHLHMHLIPRHHGDVPDPRGGLRWVLPERAVYWRGP